MPSQGDRQYRLGLLPIGTHICCHGRQGVILDRLESSVKITLDDDGHQDWSSGAVVQVLSWPKKV